MPGPLIPLLLARLGPSFAARAAASGGGKAMMARAGAGQAAAAPKITSGIPGKSGGSLMTSLVQGQAGGGSVTDLVKREHGAREKNLRQMTKTGMKYGGLVGAAALLTLGLSRMNRGVVANAESMVMWNGSIAASVAILEAERMARKMELGARTSGGVRAATQAQSRLESATLPWEAAWQNTKSFLTSTASNVVGGLIEGINEIPVVKALLAWMAKWEDGQRTNAAEQFILDVARQDKIIDMERKADERQMEDEAAGNGIKSPTAIQTASGAFEGGKMAVQVLAGSWTPE